MSAAPLPADARIPLVFGVVCPDGLEGTYDPAALTAAVKDYFGRRRHRLGDTPFLLLSRLANPTEERIVRAALDAAAGAPAETPTELVVVRTAPRAAGPAPPLLADHRYFELMGRAATPAAAELFVARGCSVLLAAFPDAAPVPLAVRAKRHGFADLTDPGSGEPVALPGAADDPLEAPETGPVVRFRLAPPGAAANPPPAPAGDTGWTELPPASYDAARPDQVEQYLKRMDRVTRHRLDRLNAEAARLVPHRRGQWDQCRGWLAAPGAATGPGPQAAAHRLLDPYATADFLAGHHQTRLWRAVRWCVLVLVVSLLLFSAYAHLTAEGPARTAALILYLVLLAVADLFLLWVFQGFTRQQLYQDFRFLAEGIRVQYGWWLGGVKRFAADAYSVVLRSELDWLRYAAKGVALRAASRPGTGPDPDYQPDVDAALSRWVVDQFGFYRRTALRERARHEFWREAASGLLVASLVVSLGVAGAAALKAAGLAPHGPHWLAVEWEEGTNPDCPEPEGQKAAPGPARPAPWLAVCYFLLLVPVGVGLYHLRDRRREFREQRDDAGEEVQQGAELIAEMLAAGPAAVDRELARQAAQQPPAFALRRRVAFWGVGVAGGLLASVGVCAAVVAFRHDLPPWLKRGVEDWLIVAMVFLVFLAALTQWHMEHRAYRLHHKNYRRMRVVFARAYVLVQRHRAADPDRAVRVLERLGHKALAEHVEWLRLHRDRPIELPRLEL